MSLLAVLLLLLALPLSRAPAVAVSDPPDSTEVRAAHAFYDRVRDAQALLGPQPLQAHWNELQAAVVLGGRAAGVRRVALAYEVDRARLSASLPLSLGFWLNADAFVRPDAHHHLRISGRLGHLPVPAFVAHAGIGLARLLLRMRGADIPPLNSLVPRFYMGQGGVAAMVDVPNRTHVVGTLTSLGDDKIDPERVAAHYCSLVRAQQQRPDPQLVEQVRRVFAEADGSAVDNRSAFVALSLLAAGMDVGALPRGPDALLARCGKSPLPLLLLGRDDLPKHWAVSAALTAVFGTQASISMGTWKEISDSGAGGSGFSLIDLSADRSGTFCADRAGEADHAAQMRQWLAQVGESDLLPVGALALAEGMTEAEFRARYASTDSATFDATVRHIDAMLAVLIRL